jgi:hypothetical protein
MVDTSTFLVTSDTKLEAFKHAILFSTLVLPYTDIDTFDLVVDDLVLDGLYLGITAGTCIQIEPRRHRQVRLQIYPSTTIVSIEVCETSTFSNLKETLSDSQETPILFDACTGVEFVDHRTIHSYADLGLVAVLPPYMFEVIYAEACRQSIV